MSTQTVQKRSAPKARVQTAGHDNGGKGRTTFDIAQIGEYTKDFGIGSLGAAELAALSKTIGSSGMQSLQQGELPVSASGELSFESELSETYKSREQELGLLDKIVSYFAKDVDFPFGGTMIKGKNGFQVKGGSVLLFPGAALDLRPAYLTGKNEGDGQQSAEGSGSVLYIMPINYDKAIQAYMGAAFIKEDGEINVSDDGAALPIADERDGMLIYKNLKIRGTVGQNAAVAADGRFTLLIDDSIFSSNPLKVIFDGKGLHIDAVETTLSGAELETPGNVLTPHNPVMTVSTDENGVKVAITSTPAVNRRQRTTEDGVLEGLLVCTYSEKNGISFSLKDISEVKLLIDGHKVLLHDPLYSDDKAALSYGSADVQTTNFEDVKLGAGYVDSQGFKTSFDEGGASMVDKSKASQEPNKKMSRPVSLAKHIEQTGGDKVKDAEDKAEKAAETSEKDFCSVSMEQTIIQAADLTIGLIKAKLGISKKEDEKSLTTSGQGNFIFFPFSVFQDSSGDGLIKVLGQLKKVELGNQNFVMDEDGLITAGFGEIETKLTDGNDEADIKITGAKIVKGAFQADGIEIEREREGFKLEGSSDGKSLAGLLNFELPTRSKEQSLKNIHVVNEGLIADLDKESYGDFGAEGVFGLFSIKGSYDKGTLEIGANKEFEPEGNGFMTKNERITLFAFPLPIPSPIPLMFTASLEPSFKMQLSFTLKGEKENGLMSDGDIKLEADTKAGIGIGIDFQAALEAGVPGIAGIYAALFAKAGLAGSDEDYAYIGGNMTMKLTKKDNRYEIDGHELELKLRGDAALKGSVGFRSGVKFLVWEGKFFEYTFKEWTLAALSASSTFTKDTNEGLLSGWSFKEGVLNAQGLGKEFQKKHTPENKYKFEADQTASISSVTAQYDRALISIDSIIGNNSENIFIMPEAIKNLAADVHSKEGELVKLIDALDEKAKELEAKYNTQANEYKNKANDIIVARTQMLGVGKTIMSEFARYGKMNRSSILTLEQIAERAYQTGDILEHATPSLFIRSDIREAEAEHLKKTGSPMTNKEKWDLIKTNQKLDQNPTWKMDYTEEYIRNMEKLIPENKGYSDTITSEIDEIKRILFNTEKHSMSDIRKLLDFEQEQYQLEKTGSFQRKFHLEQYNFLYDNLLRVHDPEQLFQEYIANRAATGEKRTKYPDWAFDRRTFISQRKTNPTLRFLYEKERYGDIHEEVSRELMSIKTTQVTQDCLKKMRANAERLRVSASEITSMPDDSIKLEIGKMKELLHEAKQLSDEEKQREYIDSVVNAYIQKVFPKESYENKVRSQINSNKASMKK